MSSSSRHRTASRCLALASLSIALLPCAAAAAPPAGGAQVVATVNGKPITEAEVRQAAAAQFDALDREYANNQRGLLESQLDQVIQDRLLDAEAKARGVSKEQILTEIAPAPVTDADIDQFYEANKAQIPSPKEQVAPKIKAYLEQQGQAKAREAFFGTLKAKYDTQILLEPLRVTVDSAGFPARGPANAPITIVEFSDFQCPYCSRVKPTLEQLLAKYPSQVRLVFRQYPLPMHENAQKAAEAALCASDQGKFWEMHDAMFGDQGSLGVDALKAKAAKLGMDAQAFGSCLDSGGKAERVKADMAAGSAAGVNGTPAMFVNGRFINGAVPLEEITKVVDDELRRQAASHG